MLISQGRLLTSPWPSSSTIHPSASAFIIPMELAPFSISEQRSLQGTLRVMRYCLLGGRCDLDLLSSLAASQLTTEDMNIGGLAYVGETRGVVNCKCLPPSWALKDKLVTSLDELLGGQNSSLQEGGLLQGWSQGLTNVLEKGGHNICSCLLRALENTLEFLFLEILVAGAAGLGI